MPGVLQIEALVQTGGVLVLSKVPDPEKYATYFLAIEQCRFRKKVIPGDTLIMHCELLTDIKRGIVKMKGRGFVSDKLVCETIMTAQMLKNVSNKNHHRYADIHPDAQIARMWR